MNAREPIDLHHAREALFAIPSDCGREEWHRIGTAAIAAGLTVDDIIAWSESAPNFSGERDVRAAFRTITPNGGIGAGTLWRAAMAAGWKPPRREQAGARRADAGRAEQPHQKANTGPRGPSAAEVWRRCEPATAAHGYIIAKGAEGAPLQNLRVVPAGDSLRIAGQPMAGALVVPALPLGGSGDEPVSLQFVPPPGQGRKLNMPGARMDGVFTVGRLEPAGIAYLCEGIATAWACWRATGRAAVCCFGWGNVGRVAAELRKRDAEGRLVLVPDAGKERDGGRIAREAGALVAAMPEGSPPNFDANDFAQAEGFDALEALLDAARAPEPAPEDEAHPLARFVALGGELRPPGWVVPGFIAEGLAVVAGSSGVGKSTALVPLACVAAGLHAPGDALAPRHWRHVVYVSEDTEQVRRILAGLVQDLNLSPELVRERFRLVEAVRLPPERVAEAGAEYRRRFARRVGEVELLPLVVLDTKSAVLALEDENSNAEASRAVAALKQNFEGLPVWLVAHLAKANLGRSDAAALTARGAGALGDDAHQTLFLVAEGEQRFLVNGKRRFEARWPELLIESRWRTLQALDAFGEPETLVLRWGIPTPPTTSRAEAREQAQEAERKQAEAELRAEVLERVGTAWQRGQPLNRKGLAAKVSRRPAEVYACIEALLAEGWLVEVSVPRKMRTHPRRDGFLVALTPAEFRAVTVEGEPVPEGKLAIPPSWRKTEASAPEADGEATREPMGTYEAAEGGSSSE